VFWRRLPGHMDHNLSAQGGGQPGHHRFGTSEHMPSSQNRRQAHRQTQQPVGGLGLVLVRTGAPCRPDRRLVHVPATPRYLPRPHHHQRWCGEATSFWLDSWNTVAPLAMALPVLFSHCVDPAMSVAGALRTGEFMLPLRDRLSSAAADNLAALRAELVGIHFCHTPDTHRLRWGAEKTFCAGTIYRMLKKNAARCRLRR
jgi:hypothetical protein